MKCIKVNLVVIILRDGKEPSLKKEIVIKPVLVIGDIKIQGDSRHTMLFSISRLIAVKIS